PNFLLLVASANLRKPNFYFSWLLQTSNSPTSTPEVGFFLSLTLYAIKDQGRDKEKPVQRMDKMHLNNRQLVSLGGILSGRAGRDNFLRDWSRVKRSPLGVMEQRGIPAKIESLKADNEETQRK
ncbi:hypothetical protein THAOC_07910, partial [Thalassiosira oceanica]